MPDPKRRIRVLIADDSAVVRKFVSDAVNADPALEVAGTAQNGRLALAKLGQVNPDVVVLDIEMPEMDGLATLRELRKTHRRLPVVMFSTLTERGAAATLDALSLGASDYVTKPSSSGAMGAPAAETLAELVRKLKTFGAIAQQWDNPPAVANASPATAPPLPVPRPRQLYSGRIEAVAIGTSTGGPNALAELMRALPADLPVPVVIVQHMPPIFTRLLAARLTAQGAIPVDEAAGNETLVPGRAWIAPGDYHLAVTSATGAPRLHIHQEAPENSCRPAVDVLFRSMAEVFGSGVLSVIMTGMGQDGLRGCESIRGAGGLVLAQDEASSVVWGMPGAVTRAGLADRVLPLAELGAEVVQRVRTSRALLRPRIAGSV